MRVSKRNKFRYRKIQNLHKVQRMQSKHSAKTLKGMYKLTEDICYFSNIADDNVVIEAGTIIEATGKFNPKTGYEFLINGELVDLVDAHEAVTEV